MHNVFYYPVLYCSLWVVLCTFISYHVFFSLHNFTKRVRIIGLSELIFLFHTVLLLVALFSSGYLLWSLCFIMPDRLLIGLACLPHLSQYLFCCCKSTYMYMYIFETDFMAVMVVNASSAYCFDLQARNQQLCNTLMDLNKQISQVEGREQELLTMLKLKVSSLTGNRSCLPCSS